MKVMFQGFPTDSITVKILRLILCVYLLIKIDCCTFGVTHDFICRQDHPIFALCYSSCN